MDKQLCADLPRGGQVGGRAAGDHNLLLREAGAQRLADHLPDVCLQRLPLQIGFGFNKGFCAVFPADGQVLRKQGDLQLIIVKLAEIDIVFCGINAVLAEFRQRHLLDGA